jgi:hypothetical protein
MMWWRRLKRWVKDRWWGEPLLDASDYMSDTWMNDHVYRTGATRSEDHQ